MPKIQRVFARQILDSRSCPTIEVSVTLDNDITAYSSAPSGGVVNKVEALELRDQDPTQYFGLGVSKAVHLVNTEINDRLKGMDPLYQNQIDQALVDLDGTPNKARLGGNSTLATSQAVMKTAAMSLNLPLFVYIKEKYRLVQDFRVPTPIFNLINGGRHGSGSLDFQEFQVVPASHLPYRKALQIGVEIFLSLEHVLEQKGAIRAVGLEGGFSPNLATNTDALEILFEACKGTSYTLSKDAFLGIDVSPQNFYRNGRFIIKDKTEPLGPKQLIKFFQDLHSQFRVFAFEDALLPDAWADWKTLTSELGATAMIMADDLIASNKTLLLRAIEENSCNALVVKPNRAGTVTETVEVVSLAKQANWHTVMSHRSGETNDDFAADLAVGVGTEYVKFGATSRGERVVKYNRLLRIQEQLEEWQAAAQPAAVDPGLTPGAPMPTISPQPQEAQVTQPITTQPENAPTEPTLQPATPEASPTPVAVSNPEPFTPPVSDSISTPASPALNPVPDMEVTVAPIKELSVEPSSSSSPPDDTLVQTVRSQNLADTITEVSPVSPPTASPAEPVAKSSPGTPEPAVQEVQDSLNALLGSISNVGPSTPITNQPETITPTDPPSSGLTPPIRPVPTNPTTQAE